MKLSFLTFSLFFLTNCFCQESGIVLYRSKLALSVSAEVEGDSTGLIQYLLKKGMLSETLSFSKIIFNGKKAVVYNDADTAFKIIPFDSSSVRVPVYKPDLDIGSTFYNCRDEILNVNRKWTVINKLLSDEKKETLLKEISIVFSETTLNIAGFQCKSFFYLNEDGDKITGYYTDLLPRIAGILLLSNVNGAIIKIESSSVTTELIHLKTNVAVPDIFCN